MAFYPQHRRGFDIDSTAPAEQKITIDDKWKGHSVTGGSTPGTIKLAGDGDKVWGSIGYFDSGQPVITDMGEDVAFKNAGTTAIPIGSKIIGATRTVDGTTVYGYVKAFDSAAGGDTASDTDAAIEAALKAKGTVVDGGGTNTSGADVSADVKVAFSRCD